MRSRCANAGDRHRRPQPDSFEMPRPGLTLLEQTQQRTPSAQGGCCRGCGSRSRRALPAHPCARGGGTAPSVTEQGREGRGAQETHGCRKGKEAALEAGPASVSSWVGRQAVSAEVTQCPAPSRAARASGTSAEQGAHLRSWHTACHRGSRLDLAWLPGHRPCHGSRIILG